MTVFEGPPRAWPIAKRAWKSTGGAFRRHPVIFLVTLVLNAALAAEMVRAPVNLLLMRPLPDATTLHTGLVYSGARLAVMLLTSLIVTPLAVCVHRHVLKDEARGSFVSACVNYFFWLAGLQLVFLAGFSYSLLASAVGFVRGLIDIIITIAAAVVTRRLLMLFPAVAAGLPSRGAEDRVETSWQQMEGNLWLTARTALITLAPLLVLAFVFARLGLPRPPAVPPIPPPPPAPPPVTMLLMIGHGLLGVVNALIAAVTAAMASWLFAATRRR